MEFSRIHPDARGPLNAWFTIVRKTDYASFVNLRMTFPSADQVGRFTVFNIEGNKFRLIVASITTGRKCTSGTCSRTPSTTEAPGEPDSCSPNISMTQMPTIAVFGNEFP